MTETAESETVSHAVDTIELNINDAAIIFEGNGKITLHIANGGLDDEEAEAPDSFIIAASVFQMLKEPEFQKGALASMIKDLEDMRDATRTSEADA